MALLVLALPPMLAGTYSGIASTDRTTVDAARAIGLTEWQVVTQVEVPHAMAIIMAGVRGAVLQVIATATLAAYTADYGLGRFARRGRRPGRPPAPHRLARSPRPGPLVRSCPLRADRSRSPRPLAANRRSGGTARPPTNPHPTEETP